MELVYPGYRVVTHIGGNTHGWPMLADRVVAGLASRISKLTGDGGTEDEAVAAAERVLAAVDTRHVRGGMVEFDDGLYILAVDGNETRLELDGGTIWVTPLDPRNDDQRDTLSAIGATSYAWPDPTGGRS